MPRNSHSRRAAGDDGDDRAEDCRGDAGLQLAKLVGGGNGKAGDRRHPAAHGVGGMQLDQARADIDREHVEPAEQGERQKGQRP